MAGFPLEVPVTEIVPDVIPGKVSWTFMGMETLNDIFLIWFMPRSVMV